MNRCGRRNVVCHQVWYQVGEQVGEQVVEQVSKRILRQVRNKVHAKAWRSFVPMSRPIFGTSRLGIPTFEDKVLQRTVRMLLNTIWEQVYPQ